MKKNRRKRENRGFRQGARRDDKWGPCRLCGKPSTLRCARCLHWRCGGLGAGTTIAGLLGGHHRLRKVKGEIGVYRVVCWPRCILRKTDADVPDAGDLPSDYMRPSEVPDPMDWEAEMEFARRGSDDDFDDLDLSKFTAKKGAKP